MILLQVGVAAIVVVLVTAWFYTTVAMIAHPKNTSTSKKILHLIVGIACGTILFIPVFNLSYSAIKWKQFERNILQQYGTVEDVLISGYRERYDISFYIDASELDFETAEEIFQLTLDELQNKMFFSAIKNQHLLLKTFEMTNIEIEFYGANSKTSSIHAFISPEADNYNKWKVSKSQDSEHTGKEYYREISPKVGE